MFTGYIGKDREIHESCESEKSWSLSLYSGTSGVPNYSSFLFFRRQNEICNSTGKNPDGDADRSDYIILNDFILNCGNL